MAKSNMGFAAAARFPRAYLMLDVVDRLHSQLRESDHIHVEYLSVQASWTLAVDLIVG